MEGVEELIGGSARKIASRGAIVGHEKGIADKESVLDLPRHMGWSVSRRVHGPDSKRAHFEFLCLVQEEIELPAINGKVRTEIVDIAKDSLHLA